MGFAATVDTWQVSYCCFVNHVQSMVYPWILPKYLFSHERLEGVSMAVLASWPLAVHQKIISQFAK